MEKPKHANFPPPPDEHVPYSENTDPNWKSLLDSSVPGRHEVTVGLSPEETVRMQQEAERTDRNDEAQHAQEIDNTLISLRDDHEEKHGESLEGSQREVSEIRPKLPSNEAEETIKRQERDKRTEARITARLGNPEVRRLIMQGDITIDQIIQEEEAREEQISADKAA